MKAREKRAAADIPLDIRNEAAAWMTQLYAADRTPATEAALRRWLAQSPLHREAFETASDMWNAAATLPVSVVGRIGSKAQRPQVRAMWSRPRLAAAAVVLAGLAAFSMALYYLRDPFLATGVGEQRTLILDDGTRVMLNTDTKMKVAYDDRVRQVVLESGEALFEVSKNPRRPFIVIAGDRRVTALGTSFVVRHERNFTAVTLVEGKVAVAPLVPISVDVAEPRAITTVLRPGERLTLGEQSPPRVDRPSLEKVTAWKRGQVALENTSLVDAIQEMNRYSEKKLKIGDEAAAVTRVSGVFRAGDSEDFALALTHVYPLKVVEADELLIIYGNEGGVQ